MALFTVTETDAGLRLDQWCKKHQPQIGFALLQKLIRKGAVKVNQHKAEAKQRLEAGQEIYLSDAVAEANPVPAPDKRQLSAQHAAELRAWVIAETPQAFVLNKPAGMAVQGGSGVKDSIDRRLDALRAEGAERPKLVHRLDKDTSGVLLLGKSRQAAAALTAAFREKTSRKAYWALVVGVPLEPIGSIEAPLAKRNTGDREKMAVVVDEAQGQHALTHYRVVESWQGRLSWLELQPITGRTHQLRVHLAHIGHPIVGDGKYGGKAAFPSLPKRIALPEQLHLHSYHIEIPDKEVKLKATAPLPPHMRESWEMLGFPLKDNGVSLLELME